MTRSTYSDEKVDAKLAGLSAIRSSSATQVDAASTKTPSSAPRSRRRQAASSTSKARPNNPRRITLDCSQEQFESVRSMRTLDASSINGLIRAMIEVVSERPDLVDLVRERAEMERH